jgi:hypothetical protein
MEEYTKAGLKNIDAIELDSLAFHQNIRKAARLKMK